MNRILDISLVGLVLVFSAGYAVSALGPRSLRRRVFTALSRGAMRAPAVLGLRRAAERLATASVGKTKGACGGCESCGETPSARKPSEGEVKVPVANITRRG